MLKVKSVLLSGVATFAAASMAQASDLPSKAAAAAPVVKHAAAHNWTGFSIGIGGGASMMQAQDYVNSNVYDYSNIGGVDSGYIANNDLGRFGGFGTIQIGADYQTGNFVLGAFADYNLGSLKASADHNAYCNAGGDAEGCNSIRTSSVEVGNSWDVGGRLGIVVNDNAMIYALAGYSFAKIKTEAYHDVASIGNNEYFDSVSVSNEHNKGGLLLGAGFEYALSENMSLKTEYRYVNYGKVSDSNYSNDNYFIDHTADVSVQSVRALLSYKF
jgi:outer membrane immunogenic protein